MIEQSVGQFSWYLDITPNKMFSHNEYPISEKDDLPLCEQHDHHLGMKETVVYAREATEAFPPDIVGCVRGKMMGHNYILSRRDSRSVVRISPLVLKPMRMC